MPKKNIIFAQSATEQLKSIDDLREFMTKVVDSTDFHDLEARQLIDFKDIMKTHYIGETGDDFGAFLQSRGGGDEDEETTGNN